MSTKRAERLELWGAQLEAMPARVAAVLEGPLEVEGAPLVPPGKVIVTGLGSSEAQARLLSHLLADVGGLHARFIPPARVRDIEGPARGRATLVVFSQGLGANARLVLSEAAGFERLVIVTAIRSDAATGAVAAAETEAGRGEAKVRVLAAACRAGATVVHMPAETDYGALVRIEGPMIGAAVAWRLAAHWLSTSGGALVGLDAGRVREAMLTAGDRLDVAFPPAGALLPFFGVVSADELETGAGEVHLTTSGGDDELASNLALKLLEGFRLRSVSCVDALAFSHGPYQSLAGRTASIVHLGRHDDARDNDVRDRLTRMLDPDRHDLRVLESTLPGAAAFFEYEQMLGWLLLRWHHETGLDPTRWPGQDEDAPLYGWGEAAEASAPPLLRDAEPAIDVVTSVEIGDAMRAGRRSLIVPLGSTEQHGAHLPLGTDTRIADALARRLAARHADAWALPALPFGCAREHLGFAGTMSVDEATLAAVVEDLIASARTHGFERVFVFSAHGGNAGVLRDMAARFEAAEAARSPVQVGAAEATRVAHPAVCVFADFSVVSRAQADVAAHFGVSPEEAGHHAGEWETSVMAALEPGRVRGDSLAEGHMKPSKPGESLFYPRLDAKVPSGVVGDPRSADPARADAYLDAWVDALDAAWSAAFVAPDRGAAKK